MLTVRVAAVVVLFGSLGVIQTKASPHASKEAAYAKEVAAFHRILFGGPSTSIYEQDVKGDEVYQRAHEAVETYLEMYGDDGSEELAKLIEARREVALTLYREHFGPWEGKPSEFDEFLAAANESPVEHCARIAVEVCGKGKVKSVHVADNSCSFECDTTATPTPIP